MWRIACLHLFYQSNALHKNISHLELLKVGTGYNQLKMSMYLFVGRGLASHWISDKNLDDWSTLSLTNHRRVPGFQDHWCKSWADPDGCFGRGQPMTIFRFCGKAFFGQGGGSWGVSGLSGLDPGAGHDHNDPAGSADDINRQKYFHMLLWTYYRIVSLFRQFGLMKKFTFKMEFETKKAVWQSYVFICVNFNPFAWKFNIAWDINHFIRNIMHKHVFSCLFPARTSTRWPIMCG